MSTMSTADLLLEEIFSWIEQREQSAENLNTLTEELESFRGRCIVCGQVHGTTATAGAAGFGGGVVTMLTRIGASLFGPAGAASSGIGRGLFDVPQITERFMSSDTMRDAKKKESEINETTERIQKLFKKLKEEKGQASSSAEDLDQQVLREIVKAMAKRRGLDHHFILNMLEKGFHFPGGEPGKATFNQSFFDPMMVTLGSVLSFFTLKASGELSHTLFKEGGQQLGKEFSKKGLKTTFKGGAMAAGGVNSLAFELPEAINQWEELIRNNYVTAASQSLRDTADDLLEISRTLREQLDKIEQMFKDFEELKSCIKNSNRTPEKQKHFVKTVEKYCKNQTVKDWLSEIYNTDAFFKLVDMFYFLKQELEKEKNKKKINQDNIEIIFVAHGSIGEPLIKASDLLLLPTVKDVVLYSPWNCAINSHAAYGIATGYLQPEERCFYCCPAEGSSCSEPHSEHQPKNMPNYWNSMKNAGEQKIPTIYIEPLREPKDRAWKRLILLENKFGEPEENRVVIPLKFPQEPGRSMRIQLAAVSFALSLVLCDSPLKATLHLAACLGRPSPKTLSQEGENLNQQYSCTIDHTMMTWRDDIFDEVVDEDSELYRTLKDVFDP